MHFGVYKPTMMFFGLINLLATFQAIINDILRDLIDTGCKGIALNFTPKLLVAIH